MNSAKPGNNGESNRALPFHTTYDVWGNVKAYKRGSYFKANAEYTIPLSTSTYDNNRQTSFSSNNGPYNPYSRVNQFDADGRLVKTTHYDQGVYPPPGNYTAVETQYGTDESPAYTAVRNGYREYYFSDGNRLTSLRKGSYYDNETQTYGDYASQYSIRSTVLGGDIVSEVQQNGSMLSTYVYGFGQVVMKLYKTMDPSTTSPLVGIWEHRDAANTQFVQSFGGGTGPAGYYNFTHLDPSNSSYMNISAWEAQVDNGGGTGTGDGTGSSYPGFGDGYGGERSGGSCYVDGIATNCSTAMNFLENGIGVQCPDHGCGPVGHNGTLYLFDPRAAAMGIGTVAAGLGYLPSNVTFTGTSFLVKGTATFNTSAFGRSMSGGGEVTLNQLNIVSDGYWSNTTNSFQSSRHSNNFFNFRDWEKKAVDSALDQAEKMTDPNDNKKCDEALKSYGIDSLNALVVQYRSGGGWTNTIDDGRATNINILNDKGKIVSIGTDPANIPAFVLGGKTYLNSGFFGGGTKFPDIRRAIILIHEAVHHFGKKKDIDFNKANQKGSITGSKAITKLIVDNCYPVATKLIDELQNL